jgi:hypothetical protein
MARGEISAHSLVFRWPANFTIALIVRAMPARKIDIVPPMWRERVCECSRSIAFSFDKTQSRLGVADHSRVRWKD